MALRALWLVVGPGKDCSLGRERLAHLGVVKGKDRAAQADHLQLAQDGADVAVGALHQPLQGHLIHLQALRLAHPQQPLRYLR